MNGDVSSSFPLDSMLHLLSTNSDAIGCVLSAKVEKEDKSKYGYVVVDQKTNEVLHFVEKPETFISDLISCGVYVFNKEIFDVMKTAIDKRRAIIDSGDMNADDDTFAMSTIRPVAEKIRLEQDVLSLLANSKKLYSYVCDSKKDFWMQIKTPTAAILANKAYLQHFNKNAPKKLSLTSPVYFLISLF
jgi:mannose-1-phosphate guanylyltransferase